jgi:hypothetical protein
LRSPDNYTGYERTEGFASPGGAVSTGRPRAVPRPARRTATQRAHGTDVDADGNGTLAQQRVYQLIRQPGPITERTFEITFLNPGAQAYCFTFG